MEPNTPSMLLFPAENVAAELDPALKIQLTESRPRKSTDPDGRLITVHDAVLVAHREPS